MHDIEAPAGDKCKKIWLPQFPWPQLDGHKYSRGHVLVIGGPLETCGAAKLSATSALKTAAGLATVLAPDDDAKKIYISSCSVNSLLWGTHDKLSVYLTDRRVTAVIVGPGFGHGDKQKNMLDDIVASGKPVLMDADALDIPRVNSCAVITPHEGEFARLFVDIVGTREERARMAASITGSVVLLKGSKTIIAATDGRLFENQSASPWLATAGSGDTLAGIIGGLMAAGMPYYEAAIAGVYIHTRAAELAGPGLLADDLVQQIPSVLRELSFDKGKGISNSTY